MALASAIVVTSAGAMVTIACTVSTIASAFVVTITNTIIAVAGAIITIANACSAGFLKCSGYTIVTFGGNFRSNWFV